MRLVAIAGLLALTPCTAVAAAEYDRPITEMVSDLSFGYCPLYLAGIFPFEKNSRLTAMGFGETPTSFVDPRLGKGQRLSATHKDGVVDLTGVPGKACNVAATGTDREAIIATLKKNMRMMGLNFAPVPAQSGQRGPALVETFKARMAPQQMLYLQLIRVTKPVAGAAAQMFVRAE